VVSSLCDRGAFFSLSGYFFREDKKKKLEVFRCIPRDRILLETDAPDMLPPEELRSYSVFSDSGNGLLNHPGNIESIYEAYAHFTGCSQKEIASEMRENLRCWLDLSIRNPREAPGPR
jgi:TatD DNase family protein